MKKYQPESHNEGEQHKENNLAQTQEQPELYNIFQRLLHQYIGKNVPNSTSTQPNCLLSAKPPHACSSGMIESLFKIVQNQTKSLQSLSLRVEQVMNKNRFLRQKVDGLQKQNLRLKNLQRSRKVVYRSDVIQEIKIVGEQVSQNSLLQILFGKKEYKYQLRLSEKLQLPLYRERNFSLQIELIAEDGTKIPNSNKIPMSLALYSCENPPKFIEKNTVGQKMLKGYIDQSLLHGQCLFQKIQIRQVTSHYRNGWLFLVVIPCMTPLGANKCTNSIDFTMIKPLVISEVTVKAKKPKKKAEKAGDEEKESDNEI